MVFYTIIENSIVIRLRLNYNVLTQTNVISSQIDFQRPPERFQENNLIAAIIEGENKDLKTHDTLHAAKLNG